MPFSHRLWSMNLLPSYRSSREPVGVLEHVVDDNIGESGVTEFGSLETFVAGTRRGDLRDRSIMRNHARSLNPLARGYLSIPPDANFRMRQRRAPLRYSRTQSASAPLAATIDQEPEHRVVRPAGSPRRHTPTGRATLDYRSR